MKANIKEKSEIKFHKAIIRYAEKKFDVKIKSGTTDTLERIKMRADYIKWVEHIDGLDYIDKEFKQKIKEPLKMISNPDIEPEDAKDKFLRFKEGYQAKAKNYHGDHFDYGTQWECADEMRWRKDEGEYNSYADAFRFAVKHYTANGKAIPSIKRLEKAYKDAKDSCYPLKSQPVDYWDK